MASRAVPSKTGGSQQIYDERFKKLVNEIHSASNPNAIMVGLRNKILNIYDVEMATIFSR